MLDREIVLTGIYPESAAHNPAAGKARVDRKRPVDQPDHRAEIFAESSQKNGRRGEGAGVVLAHLERLPGKLDGSPASCLRRFGPAVIAEPVMAERRPGQCRPVMRIDRDRLFEQSQSLDNPLFRYWVEGSERAQVEIVGGEI